MAEKSAESQFLVSLARTSHKRRGMSDESSGNPFVHVVSEGTHLSMGSAHTELEYVYSTDGNILHFMRYRKSIASLELPVRIGESFTLSNELFCIIDEEKTKFVFVRVTEGGVESKELDEYDLFAEDSGTSVKDNEIDTNEKEMSICCVYEPQTTPLRIYCIQKRENGRSILFVDEEYIMHQLAFNLDDFSCTEELSVDLSHIVSESPPSSVAAVEVQDKDTHDAEHVLIIAQGASFRLIFHDRYGRVVHEMLKDRFKEEIYALFCVLSDNGNIDLLVVGKRLGIALYRVLVEQRRFIMLKESPSRPLTDEIHGIIKYSQTSDGPEEKTFRLIVNVENRLVMYRISSESDAAGNSCTISMYNIDMAACVAQISSSVLWNASSEEIILLFVSKKGKLCRMSVPCPHGDIAEKVWEDGISAGSLLHALSEMEAERSQVAAKTSVMETDVLELATAIHLLQVLKSDSKTGGEQKVRYKCGLHARSELGLEKTVLRVDIVNTSGFVFSGNWRAQLSVYTILNETVRTFSVLLLPSAEDKRLYSIELPIGTSLLVSGITLSFVYYFPLKYPWKVASAAVTFPRREIRMTRDIHSYAEAFEKECDAVTELPLEYSIGLEDSLSVQKLPFLMRDVHADVDEQQGRLKLVFESHNRLYLLPRLHTEIILGRMAEHVGDLDMMIISGKKVRGCLERVAALSKLHAAAFDAGCELGAEGHEVGGLSMAIYYERIFAELWGIFADTRSLVPKEVAKDV